MGLVGGALTELTSPQHKDATQIDPVQKRKRTWRDGIEHGLEVLRSIWLWMLIGVLISAAIEHLVPESFLATVGGQGILTASLFALVIGLPLYVCATASVPIAAQLVASGLPSGAALVFLIAGPATNVATVGAIFGKFGFRVLLIYLSTIICGSISSHICSTRCSPLKLSMRWGSTNMEMYCNS